jgi:hypothetical protein
LHPDQVALAAAYREQQVEREFQLRQQQLRAREAELARVKQQAMEEVSVHALQSIRATSYHMGSMDATAGNGLFALQGAARWAAITRQRLFGGGATLLLEMEAGADQLAADLSDPALMERYARARAQAAVQQREMNEWNRVMQEEARAEAEHYRQHGHVTRGETPMSSADEDGMVGGMASGVRGGLTSRSRSVSPGPAVGSGGGGGGGGGLRHRRGNSMYSSNPGDGVGSSTLGAGARSTSPFPVLQVTPAFMRLAPGVGAALGFAPDLRPPTPEAIPNMATLVKQLVAQQRAKRRQSMEMGSQQQNLAAALASASASASANKGAGGGAGGARPGSFLEPGRPPVLSSPSISTSRLGGGGSSVDATISPAGTPRHNQMIANATAAAALSFAAASSSGALSSSSSDASPSPPLSIVAAAATDASPPQPQPRPPAVMEVFLPADDGRVQSVLHSPSAAPAARRFAAPEPLQLFMPSSDGEAQPVLPMGDAAAAAAPLAEPQQQQQQQLPLQPQQPTAFFLPSASPDESP